MNTSRVSHYHLQGNGYSKRLNKTLANISEHCQKRKKVAKSSLHACYKPFSIIQTSTIHSLLLVFRQISYFAIDSIILCAVDTMTILMKCF